MTDIKPFPEGRLIRRTTTTVLEGRVLPGGRTANYSDPFGEVSFFLDSKSLDPNTTITYELLPEPLPEEPPPGSVVVLDRNPEVAWTAFGKTWHSYDHAVLTWKDLMSGNPSFTVLHRGAQ